MIVWNYPTDVADIVRIYCADHTYVSLKTRMDATVEKIIEMASTKISLGEDLVLCEVKSNGGTSCWLDNDDDADEFIVKRL